MPAPYRRVGRVTRVHGTTGEVVVALAGDLSVRDLDGLTLWVVPPPGHVRTYRIDDVRKAPKGLLARLSGVDDVASAHELVGRLLLVRESDVPDISAEDQGYVGYAVRDAERGDIGRVMERIVTGANDVLVVEEGPFGQVLVPVIPDVVRQVDDDERVLHVSLLEGLIDEDGDM